MTSRTDKLRARRTDPLKKALGTYEVLEKIVDEDPVRYVVQAMQPIDPEYTKNTFEEGERVRGQLSAGLVSVGLAVEYRYQGSTTSDTHIKAHSDLDMLTIHTAFFTLEPPQKTSFPYRGDWLADLRKLRTTSARVLRAAYPTATVDESGGKALAISGGSLRRKIEVIAANWWDTNEYAQTGQEYLRGVDVFDNDSGTRVENKPFLHNKRIDDRDRAVAGNLRKAIRLMKSVKYDADTNVDISSYDIAALGYRMPDQMLHMARGQELLLLQNISDYLRYLVATPAARIQLKVPNEMRLIFGRDGVSDQGLAQLSREVEGLRRDVESGLSKSFRKLAEARVSY